MPAIMTTYYGYGITAYWQAEEIRIRIANPSAKRLITDSDPVVTVVTVASVLDEVSVAFLEDSSGRWIVSYRLDDQTIEYRSEQSGVAGSWAAAPTS
jgi:hypothetical protein